MATAMIRCLRTTYPLAQIDMVVRSDFFDLIKNNPHLDGKFAVARDKGIFELYRFLKKVNQQRYDLVYDAHRSLRTSLLMPFIKAPRKAYLRKNYLRRSLALTFKLKSLIRGSKRMLERYVEPLLPVGVQYDGLGPELFMGEPAPLPFAPPDQKGIGIIPSAQWEGKRWPTQHFRKTIELLLEKTTEKFFIFGGPSDSFCNELVSSLPTDRVINLQGKLTLEGVFQAFQHVKMCIANDTGLMHVGDAFKIPNVLIFGPTNSDMGCLPFHPQSRVVEHELWCRPCSKNGQAPCIRGRRVCLELTTPELVAQTAEDLLKQL